MVNRIPAAGPRLRALTPLLVVLWIRWLKGLIKIFVQFFLKAISKVSWVCFYILLPEKLKTAESISVRSPILIKHHDKNVLLRHNGFFFLTPYLCSTLSISTHQNILFLWVGRRGRDSDECLALLRSASKFCNPVKYILILAFAVWSVPDNLLLFTCSKNNIKRHFPTIGLKTEERQIQNVIALVTVKVSNPPTHLKLLYSSLK